LEQLQLYHRITQNSRGYPMRCQSFSNEYRGTLAPMVTERGERPRTSGLGMEAALPESIPTRFFGTCVLYFS
jgi:hypothetical protein